MALAGVPSLAGEKGNTTDPPAPPEDPPWKLTVGYYQYQDYGAGDLNLRWRADDTDAWAGVYHDPDFGTQARLGADTSIALAKYIQLQPSLQLATGGFVGGSINLQVGKEWFGLAGIGRTDLKTYYNLNFDPNDALTFGAGHQAEDGTTYTLFVVADDRLHTGQRDWHLTARLPFTAGRATLDLLHKNGESDVGYVSAWGFSGTWDWPKWFVRLAYDPYQNFSAQNAWRLATGVRF
jgi:hypothetical protein